MKSSLHATEEEEGDRVLHLPSYTPSQRALAVLQRGKIIADDEDPQHFLERIIDTIFLPERAFGTTTEETKRIAEEFAGYLVDGYVMPGTPFLTNAGRYQDFPLSSCALIPVDLRQTKNAVETQIRSYYRQNMGAGFEFSDYDDPASLLVWLNDFSAREAASQQYDRYIGNMGMLHIGHPRIKDFITAKREREMRHFNISVDVTEYFMQCVEERTAFRLFNGEYVDAGELLMAMSENAWYNGDPGLIFMERMNRDNPVVDLATFISTPSCAEMGLTKGEACHFGNINVHRFVRREHGRAIIDYSKLQRVTELLTRVLDNAIEYSLPRFPMQLSADVARLNRKIAIGVCGLADLLLEYNVPYDSPEARALARDVLSYVNYISKRTSVALAEQRGSCEAMNYPESNRYLSERFLETKYEPTATVSAKDWEQLGDEIRSRRLLRNVSTTALAPTGRSSILLGVNSSIEPFFSLTGYDAKLLNSVEAFLERELADNEEQLERTRETILTQGSVQHCSWLLDSTRACLQTAKEISSDGHLQMVAALAGMNGVIDESASKTVNLPHEATVADVQEVFMASYRLGLKNISVYRDQTKAGQPMAL